MENTQFKFIDLHNKDATPSYKFDATGGSVQATHKSFLEHISGLYRRDQALKKPDLTSVEGKILTSATGTRDVVYSADDTGLFGTVFKAWANHWNLRTSADDWWLPVTKIVAARVDDYADNPAVRQLFRNGKEGKELIAIKVSSFTIDDTDYTYLFNAFSAAIKEKIEVPGYVDAISSDFSTTTPTQLIASQITLMKSMQKYFEYEMMMCGCGLNALEMKGNEQDWVSLQTKLHALKNILQPIENVLGLKTFFATVDQVYTNLIATYKGESKADWWKQILFQGKATKYVGGGGSMPGKPTQVDSYNGWFIPFISGGNLKQLVADDLTKGKYNKELSGLSSCPMKVTDCIRNISDESVLISGIMGFNVHENSQNGIATLEPATGWVMMLPPDSRLRQKSGA